MVRLAVDFEHPSRTWWDSGGTPLWEAITEGFDGSAVILDDDLAESWLEQARKVAGWDGGPDYAPHPITVTRADDEDDLL